MRKYPPTSQELRSWMDSKGLSNKDVARALRLSDGRVVRFWTSRKNPRPIPYPSWYTLRHKFGKGPGKKRSAREARAVKEAKAGGPKDRKVAREATAG